MPARPITFSLVACSSSFAVTLVAERMASPSKSPMICGELVFVLAEIGLEIDLDAAILEDRDGGGRERVGNENSGSHGSFLRFAKYWHGARLRREMPRGSAKARRQANRRVLIGIPLSGS